MAESIVGLDLDSLEAYFRREVPGFAGLASAELIHGGRSNLTYLLSTGDEQWVLRRPPLGGLTPSAHDMGREYRVVDALQNTGVPVARTVSLCEDIEVIGAPFAVVAYVGGIVLRTESDLHDLAQDDLNACAHALMATLAQLHDVPPAQVGLEGFGKPDGYLRRQVRRWIDQWHRVSTRELPDLDRLYARLAESVPVESGSAIVHGDFRVDNAILHGDRLAEIRAVLDWEMAALGDPLADLGLSLVYRDPAFAPVLGGDAASTSARMPDRDSLAESYARTSGRDLGDLSFYLALGYFKIAVIAEGIHARYLDGKTVGGGFDTVGPAVPELVAAGLRAYHQA